MNITYETLQAIKARANRQLDKIRGEHNEIQTRVQHMSLAEIKEEAMKMPAMTHEVYERMLVDSNEAFTTGSMVYGDPSKAKDIDWVTSVPLHAFEPRIIYKGGMYQDDIVVGYGNYNGKLLNIIFIYDYNLYQAWHIATVQMTIMSSHPDMVEEFETKWRRVRVFRALVDAVYHKNTHSLAHMDAHEAKSVDICKICRLEAINFTSKVEKKKYWADGICERCRTTE